MNKLDYIPEEWFVTSVSSVQSYNFYDIKTISEAYYTNLRKTSLKIKNMNMDYDEVFPSVERTADLLTRDYLRMRLLKRQ